MKILHTGDWHLRDSKIDEANKCLSFLIDTAKDELPDVILLAGDLYHSSQVKADSKAVKLLFWAVSELAEIAPVAVIIGTPSHEGTATTTLKHINARHSVHVSTLPEQYLLKDGQFYSPNDEAHPDAVISAFPAPTKQFFKNNSSIIVSESEIATGLAAIMAGFAAGVAGHDCPHIVMGHIQVGGACVSESQQLTGVDIEISRDQLSLSTSDLVVLGHLHLRQKIEPNIFYSGSLYSQDWGEMETKGFYVYDLADGISEKFIETPSQPMVDIKIDWTKDEIDQHYIKSAYPEISNAQVRVTIKLFVDQYEKLDVPAIKSWHEKRGNTLQLEPIRLPRANVRAVKILDQEKLYDKIKVNAEILGEPIPPGVKEKAEMVESMAPEALIELVKELESRVPLEEPITCALCGETDCQDPTHF